MAASGSLYLVRSVLSLLCFVASACVIAQSRQGIYKPAQGDAQPWAINDHHALFWKGEPYRPVGLRIDGTLEAVERANQRGVKDVIVDLPLDGAAWKTTLTALESRSMRYIVAIDSIAPAATGFAIEPQSYRISGITATKSFTIPLPGVKSVFAITAAKRDSAIAEAKRIPVVDGVLKVTANLTNDLEHVLLLYPETTSAATLDSWELFDAHRDMLLRAVKVEAGGAGLRGILNPLGQLLNYSDNRSFVPTNPRFQTEFALFLEERYRNIETAQKSWSMSVSEVETFDHLARLVPLWNGSRGIESLWDPATNNLVQVEAKKSAYWADIRACLNLAESRRFQRLVSALRKVADVPVVQEWRGWSPHVEAASPQIDGIAFRTNGTTVTQIAETAARAASSVARWQTKGWLFASGIDATNPASAQQLPAILDDLESMGAQAFFVRTADPAVEAQIATENGRRSTSFGAANSSTTPLFFPENALNPAAIQRLPGGRWWLPAPSSGNRLDLGTQFFGYRIGAGSGSSTVIWTTNPLARVKLKFANPRSAKVSSIDGSNLDPKVVRGGLEVFVGSSPIIVEGEDIPIPETSVLELTAKFAALMKDAAQFRLSVGEEEFVFTDAMAGLERSPAGSYLRAVEAVEALNRKLARYVWLEAENFADSTFSEVQDAPGTSEGTILNLRSMLPGLVNDAYAEYTFQNRTSSEVDVWIAARIPPSFRSQVSIVVGGQTLRVQGEPVSLYDGGFGWYRLGSTRFAQSTGSVKLRVAADVGTELAVDAIVFAPAGFRPDGVRRPSSTTYTIGKA